MAEQIVIKRCTKETKEQLKEYWQKKAGRLGRLLRSFAEDQRHLCLTLDNNGGRFEGTLVLKLPTGNLRAGHAGENGHYVIDLLVDKMTKEIKKHKGKIRHDDLYRRKSRRENLKKIVPLLEDEKHRIDKNNFFTLLTPVLRQLEETARHEIIIAQLQSNILPGELTVQDVLDDVLLRAWEQFEDYNNKESLDSWVTKLLHQVIDEKIKDRLSELSIYEELAASDPRYTADSSWVCENEPFWEEPVNITINEIFPDEDTLEPWQAMDAEEQLRWLLAHLSTLPVMERRAFTLYFREGLSEEEIAMMQDRSVEEVKANIQNVSDLLVERFKQFDREQDS